MGQLSAMRFPKRRSCIHSQRRRRLNYGRIFAYPGVGYQIYNAIKSLDYPLIQGGVLIIILSVALANFVIDVIYPIIDPRIRYSGSGGK